MTKDIDVIKKAISDLLRISIKFEPDRIFELQKIVLEKLKSLKILFVTSQQQIEFERFKIKIQNNINKPFNHFKYDDEWREPVHGVLRIINECQVQNNSKAFLSYSTMDKILAGKIKNALEKVGIESFLAHEDISISEEWREKLKQELFSCGILIPIITCNFLQSEWTSQEVGIVFGRDGLIVPIIFGHTKIPGFLSAIQGISYNENDESFETEIASKIKKIITQHAE